VATLIFANGLELSVTEPKSDVLAQIGAAQRGGSDVSGWIALTTADGAEVAVQVVLIAYVRA